MDIIAGLPGETPEDMEDTLRQIALLGPDNLTVHSLAIKRAAKMGQEEREGKRLTIIQDEIGTMVEMAGNKARQMGLFRIICIVRRILPEILRMWAMQRLTKQEYTIYLLWKKSNPLLPRGREHLRKLY